MRRTWQYVREAWQKTELQTKDREMLETWIEAIDNARQDAFSEGIALGARIPRSSPPGDALQDELVEAPKAESYRLFEFKHGTVQYWEKLSPATNKIMERLYVQVIDSYSFQCEWTLQRIHLPGHSDRFRWESHIYQHPGRRTICYPTPQRAKKLLERFLYLCKDYPTLLFNEDSPTRVRFSGFVHFAEALHAGAIPNESML